MKERKKAFPANCVQTHCEASQKPYTHARLARAIATRARALKKTKKRIKRNARFEFLHYFNARCRLFE